MSKLRVDLDAYPQLSEPGQAVLLRKELVWLIRGKRRLRAYSARCPHKPKEGRIVRDGSERGCYFRCPLHSWTFTRRGKPTGRSKKPMRRLPLVIKGGVARIELP
ncbi:MAG: Rieske 2Fe-2S domain-containing protein [Planctomycetes bacterium]|nr:Rieske 2Fe-2S domain-containing protein [Planctomycetota bacterium]